MENSILKKFKSNESGIGVMYTDDSTLNKQHSDKFVNFSTINGMQSQEATTTGSKVGSKRIPTKTTTTASQINNNKSRLPSTKNTRSQGMLLGGNTRKALDQQIEINLKY